MASVKEENILVLATNVVQISRLAEAAGQVRPFSSATNEPTILIYDPSFTALLNPNPSHSLLLSTDNSSKNPFFHEACVYLPTHSELYTTSNLLQGTKSSSFPTILISRIKLHRGEGNHIKSLEWSKLRPPPGIDMPNGGVNYKDDGIIFCAQGTASPRTGGLWHLPRSAPPSPIITNFLGRDFNSVNDVVVSKKDGSIWFTDPSYAHAQDFRQKPKLPNQVYRYNPVNGDIRVVADGLYRPNGLCFDVEEKTMYITDTGMVEGDGDVDARRPATIYAYDVLERNGGIFLANKRVFAYSSNGIPDGIKCDLDNNVYSGCGDGLHVWNSAGTLLGKIIVQGGVANFCFGEKGEMFLCNETRLWRICLGENTKGALLGI